MPISKKINKANQAPQTQPNKHILDIYRKASHLGHHQLIEKKYACGLLFANDSCKKTYILYLPNIEFRLYKEGEIIEEFISGIISPSFDNITHAMIPIDALVDFQ